MHFLKLFSLILILGTCFWASQARALSAGQAGAGPEIIITEIMYNPAGTDTGHEWLEIYNRGAANVTIIDGSGANSWRFSDGSPHLLKLVQGDLTIVPQKFAILTAKAETFLADYPGFTGTIIETAMSLANTGDTLRLSNDKGVSWFYQLTYESSWGADGTGRSLEKIDFEGDDQSSNWQESFVDKGTPGTISSLRPVNNPPVADAGDDREAVVGMELAFDGSGSSDPDGDQLNYTWEFGDGTKNSGLMVKHVYGALGEFTATLTVSDGKLTSIDTVKVRVKAQDLPDKKTTVKEYSRQITINEISPNPPGDDGQNEFIELQNLSDGEVNLEGWKLADASAKVYTIKKDDFSQMVIPAHSYFVVFRKTSRISLNNSGEESVKLFWPNDTLLQEIKYVGPAAEGESYALVGEKWVWTTKPTPGAQNVFLSSNHSPEISFELKGSLRVGQKITFDASDSEDKDDDKLTFKWSFGDGNSAEGEKVEHLYQSAGLFSVVLKVSDGEAEVEASKTITIASFNFSTKVFLSELLPDPKDAETREFIEIVNRDNQEIDLEGWQLASGKKYFKFPSDLVIKPGELLVFYRELTKLTLANLKGTVYLIDPAGKIIQGVTYEKARSGLAWARDDHGQWRWTKEPTPAKPNLIEEESGAGSEDQVQEGTSGTNQSANQTTTKSKNSQSSDEVIEVSLKEAKKLAKGAKVKVQGQVVVLPGVFGSQYFYIRDQATGLKIYYSKKDFPKLALGDWVEAKGQLSEANNEKKINLASKDDLKILKHEEIGEIQNLSLEELNEEMVGSLVKVSGEVVQKTASNFLLADQTGNEIGVYLKGGANIRLNDLTEGQQLEVSGIVSLNKDGLIVLPRLAADLQKGQVLGASVGVKADGKTGEIKIETSDQKKKMMIYLSVALGAGLVILAGVLVRKKLNSNPRI